MQKVRAQLQAEKAKVAELRGRVRKAQLALLNEYDFTISAVCAIFDPSRDDHL
jgi:hypothetical protein